MSRIPLDIRGHKPRFFPAQGIDELLGMVLELTAELWTVKERMYVLERVLADAVPDLPVRIEDHEPAADEIRALGAERQRMIARILRTIEADYVDRASVQEEHDRNARQTEKDASQAAA